MKLKFIGHICPGCGANCEVQSYHGRGRRLSNPSWLGYYLWSACYTCHIAYLILFDQNKRFIGIMDNEGHSERSGILVQAGERQTDPDEIPF